MTKTHAQLLREIAVLQAAADKQRGIESQGAVARINDLIVKHGLTAADLKFASRAAESVPTPSAVASKSVAKKASKTLPAAATNPARFSDGKGNQWGGRGPRPAWLRAALEAGQTLESFLNGATPTTEAPASAGAARAPKAAAKKSAGNASSVGASAAPSTEATASRKIATQKPAAKKAAAKKAAGTKRAAKKAAPKKKDT